jgi:hypothetical protein
LKFRKAISVHPVHPVHPCSKRLHRRAGVGEEYFSVETETDATCELEIVLRFKAAFVDLVAAGVDEAFGGGEIK